MLITEAIYQTTKNILAQIQHLLTQLRHDNEYIRTDALALLEESNHAKTDIIHQLIEDLHILISQLQLSLPVQNIFEHLQQFTQHLSGSEKEKMQLILTTLHEGLTQCYHQLTVNRGIVGANVIYTKDLFAALLQHSSRHEPSIYGPRGHIELESVP